MSVKVWVQKLTFSRLLEVKVTKDGAIGSVQGKSRVNLVYFGAFSLPATVLGGLGLGAGVGLGDLVCPVSSSMAVLPTRRRWPCSQP